MPALSNSCPGPRPLPVGTARPMRRTSHSQRIALRTRVIPMALKDPYDVLGVPRTASEKDIKSAFRKKALKLHPDVNKAPDAKERFMECKNAYQDIISSRKSFSGRKEPRSRENERSTGGHQSSASSGWWDPAPQQQEDFYGFTDFFRDLEKELSAHSSTEPKGLWEELADLGEEFVEFLEKGVGIQEEHAFRSTERWETAQKPEESSTNTTSSPGRKPPSATSSIDQELEELKRKLGM